jgi:hypothetical protein
VHNFIFRNCGNTGILEIAHTNYSKGSNAMSKLLDKVIEESLMALQENKYKIRLFQADFKVKIESRYGVEETLQGIRAIPGVTVVTALDSLFNTSAESYVSSIRIKFHPRQESTTPGTYISDILLPQMNDLLIPGLRVISQTSKAQRIS